MRPGARLFRLASSKVESVHGLMARSAFSNLPNSDVLNVCQFFGFSFDSGMSLFDLLFAAVDAIFGEPGGEEAMASSRIRFSLMPSMLEYAGDLLEVDEAAVLLDQRDREKLGCSRSEDRTPPPHPPTFYTGLPHPAGADIGERAKWGG